MASLVISPSIASIGWMMMLTAKVAATPAKPAARPAIGLRFRLANAAAASGIRIRYPASEATLDSPPTRMIRNAISRRGATATSLRIKAPISPADSARPAPIIAMNVTAMTPKFWKLGTNDVNRKRIPSIVSRPLIGDRLLLRLEVRIRPLQPVLRGLESGSAWCPHRSCAPPGPAPARGPVR